MKPTSMLTGAILAALAAAPVPAARAETPASAPDATPTVAQLRAENQALKAQVARLRPLTMSQQVSQVTSFRPAGMWILVGFFGQFVFFMRFVVQWIATERKKKSVVPAAFCLNVFIYMRNLYFIHRKPRCESASSA